MAEQAAVTSKPDYTRLTQLEIKRLFQMHSAGMTQQAIAEQLGCSQRTVSTWVQDLTDTTDLAKLYLRGQALRMSQNVVKNGRAADHNIALKGLNVLEEQQAGGLTIVVGAGSDVKIGILSPSVSQDIHRLSDDSKPECV